VSRGRAEVTLGGAVANREPSLRLELLVGALRPERADFLVEKATELGVVAVRFLRTERTPRNYGDGRLDRLRRVAVSAVEQCHRSLVPEVSLHDWVEVDRLRGSGESAFVLDPESDQGLSASGKPSAVVLIGPEGGLTDDELAHVRGLGAEGVRLGERILRVETAAIASAALLLVG